jgi:hypothetical protein
LKGAFLWKEASTPFTIAFYLRKSLKTGFTHQAFKTFKFFSTKGAVFRKEEG